MNNTRIMELRQSQGWTQERLANESGVGLRTIQRLEAGQDASLETLSLVAEALHVPVKELFTSIDDAAMSSKVDSLQDRTDEQQSARDRISGAWRWLYIGVGVVLTLVSFTAIRRIYLEPRLDEKYPLSRAKPSRRERRKAAAQAR